MNELSGQIVKLLRRHPLLWVPQVCAAFLGAFLFEACSYVPESLWRALKDSHSVLHGLAVPAMRPVAQVVLHSIIAIPAMLLAILLHAAACLIALVTIACLIYASTRGVPAGFRDGLGWARQRYRSIRNLALAALGLFLVQGVANGTASAFVLSRDGHLLPFLHAQTVYLIAEIVVLSLASYLLAPGLLRLVHLNGASSISRREVRRVRVFAALASVGWIALQYYLWLCTLGGRLPMSLGHRELDYWAFNLGGILVEAFLLTLVSIAFSVIAQEPDEVHGEVIVA